MSEFKRGDRVVYIQVTDYGVQVAEATVTATKGDTVYARCKSENGSEWKKSFSPAGRLWGSYGESQALWTVRMLQPGDSVKRLERFAEKATAKYREYKDAIAQMEREVENLAWQWKRNELDKRRAEIKGGYQDMLKSARKMGFKVPRNKA